jgi:SAM-dependent methyltransferase
MVSGLRKLYRAAVTVDHEVRQVIRFVDQAAGTKPHESCRVLDVGCGYGRYLRQLRESGFAATGVEANLDIVNANRRDGLPCLTAEEFAGTVESYDVILMSHVIEHFAPQDLVHFMDRYLDRLRVDGTLVVATPLLTRFFFDDFDHIKPYHPLSLLMVFGEEGAQVQYYSQNTLRLEDVWFRRGHWRFAHRRNRFVRTWMTRAIQMVEFASAVAFRASVGLIGQTDGWVGLFRKTGTRTACGLPASSQSAG